MPDVGYTSAGASSLDGREVIWGVEGTTDGTGGAVTSISVYGRETTTSNSNNAKVGVYRKSDGALMAAASSSSTPFTTTAGWRTITYAGPTLAASTTYLPSVWMDSNGSPQCHIYYDSTGAEGADHYVGSALSAFPDPAGWFNEDTGSKYSIYATYGSSGNVFDADGISTATGSGASQASVPANSAGASTATERGAALASVPINAAGASSAIAVGASVVGGDGALSAVGISTAIAAGTSTATSLLNAAGTSTAIENTASLAGVPITSAGASVGTMVGAALSEGASAAYTAGVSTAQAATASLTNSNVTSIGVSTAKAATAGSAEEDAHSHTPLGRRMSRRALAKQRKKEQQALIQNKDQDADDMQVIKAALQAALKQFYMAA